MNNSLATLGMVTLMVTMIGLTVWFYVSILAMR